MPAGVIDPSGTPEQIRTLKTLNPTNNRSTILINLTTYQQNLAGTTINPETGTVCVFRQKIALDDAIGSHTCSLEVNMRVANGIPLGSSLSYQLTL